MQPVYVVKTRKKYLLLLIRLLYQHCINDNNVMAMWLQGTMRSAQYGLFLVVPKQHVCPLDLLASWWLSCGSGNEEGSQNMGSTEVIEGSH
jgi:hypothetical protein